MSDLDKKISVSIGCTNFLVNEVESLRRQNELMGAQLAVVNSFFGMIERLGSPKSQGYSQDQLFQAKKEIREATEITDSKGKDK